MFLLPEEAKQHRQHQVIAGGYTADYYNQYDENYQIQQYHQEIRNHYAQQNPSPATVAAAVPANTVTHQSVVPYTNTVPEHIHGNTTTTTTSSSSPAGQYLPFTFLV